MHVIWSYLQRLPHPGDPTSTDLRSLREWLGDLMINIAVFVFPVGLAISLPTLLGEKHYGVIALNGVVYGLLLVRFLKRNWVSIRPPVLWIAILYGLTITFFVTFGPGYARTAWLMLCSVMIALYFGARAGFLSVLFNMGLLTVLHGLVGRDNPAWAHAFSLPSNQWLMYVVNTSLLTLVASVPSAHVLDRLDRTLTRERQALADLSAQREKLREVNESLRESEQRIQLTFNEAPMGAAVVGLGGEIEQVNGEFCRFLNREPDSLTGRPFVQLLADTHQGEYQEAVRSLIAKPRDLWQQDILFDNPLAGPRWGRISLRAVRGREEKALYLLPMIEDVHERRGMEKEKARLETRLAQSQKMEALGTLAGGIAHDFNNILTVILARSQMALKKTEEGRLHDDVHSIISACLRATDLVRQILSFSRQGEQAATWVDLRPIVKEVMKMMRASLPANVGIEQEIAAGLPNVMADPTQVHQILMNLCTNAYHAIGDGQGTIRVVLKKVRLEPDLPVGEPAPPAAEHLLLSVSDTGIGIAPEDQAKIFEPYYTTKKPGEGTGLGLSVVHGLVRAMNGTIRVESRLGEGAEFQVYLPVNPSDSAVREPKEEKIPGGRGHILFVDDEEAIIDIARDMLESLGYQVTPALACQEALEAISARPDDFDLVITDYFMPVMSGLELTGKIRKVRSDIPIILCTGFIERVDNDQLIEAGITEVLTKPFPMLRLARAIRNALGESPEESPGP